MIHCPTFEDAVKATGKDFRCERTTSGYYRLVCGDYIVLDDSACEDVDGTEEEAKAFFSEYLMSEVVPEEMKIFHYGRYILK